VCHQEIPEDAETGVTRVTEWSDDSYSNFTHLESYWSLLGSAAGAREAGREACCLRGAV